MATGETGPIWTTGNGGQLEIAWMDSAHLNQSWRMTVRRGKESPALYAELVARGFAPATQAPTFRETPIQLCWVRAIIESGRRGLLRVFYNDPETFPDWICATPSEANKKVIASALKYRLTR